MALQPTFKITLNVTVISETQNLAPQAIAESVSERLAETLEHWDVASGVYIQHGGECVTLDDLDVELELSRPEVQLAADDDQSQGGAQ